uniref:Uncharacterized protein LOC100184997 n=1 Tax=Phallusia mammillata TaxID=59560 RepID=A0A6F9DIU2_9ASCI|nr:uncharacterized protein LOC100184997 [Phallusia mammillata]
MTALGVSQDYPDLDELLDIGDASDAVQPPNSCSAGSFQSNDCIEVLDWYSDTSEIAHKQYGSQIEFEKDKKENEAGLLEALQKSMDMECDTVSDLVSLSSSLDHPPLPLSSSSSLQVPSSCFALPQSSSSYSPLGGSVSMSPSTGDNLSLTSVVSSATEVSLDDMEESDESMLKQLLLSRTNIIYPREVDSNNNCMLDHVAVNVVPKASDSNGEDKRRKKKTAKKQSITKKPFTELLKHFESTNPDSASKTAKANSTRVVNASRYQKQYGSAPVSRLPSPVEDDSGNAAKSKSTKATKRMPVATRSSGRRQTIDVTLPLKKSLSAANKGNTQGPEKMIVAADADSLLDILENKSPSDWKAQSGIDCSSIKSRMLIDKRRSTVLIDPLPHKRQKIGTDGKMIDEESSTNTDKAQPADRQCTEKPSAEHDYCHKETPQPESSDLLSAVLEASGLSSNSDAIQNAGDDIGVKSNKVLKWQDYLQRVRLGIRSAPNSPTSSPKMQRGSARGPNNFMVLNNPGVVRTTARPVTRLVEPIVAAKVPKQKTNLQLQEFEEYIAKLQNNTNVTATVQPSLVSSNPPSVSISTNVGSQKAGVAKDEAILLKPRAPPKRSKQVTVPNIASKSFVKISSGGVVHTAAVSSAHPSSSTPLVMIQIPKAGSTGSVVTLGSHVYTPATSAKYVSAVAAPSTTPVPATVQDLLKDPRVSHKPKPTTGVNVVKPISKVKWNADGSTPVSSTVLKPVTASQISIAGQASKTTASSGPTFKLVTSNKGGLETKSLILSGVSGKLKEILTLLAQQQQQQGSTSTSTDNSQQQQKTLQQLLTAVSNLKNATTTHQTTSTATTKPVTSSTAQNTINNATTVMPEAAKIAESRKSVPSPLSLIHEIKQNLSKKTESAVSVKSVSKTKPQYVYTVPASSTVKLAKVPENAMMTTGGGVLSLANRRASAESTDNTFKKTVTRRHSTQERVSKSQNSENRRQNVHESNQITVFVDQVDKQSSKAKSSQALDDTYMLDSDLLGIDEATNEIPTQDGNLSEMDLLACKDLPLHASEPFVESKTNFLSLNAQTPRVFYTDPNAAPVPLIHIKPGKSSEKEQTKTTLTSKSATKETTSSSSTLAAVAKDSNSNETNDICNVNEEVGVKEQEVLQKMKKVPLRRSMAASEMLEDFDVNEVLHQLPVSSSEQPDVLDLRTDATIDEVAIQETVECAEESDSEQHQPMLFNKLPAYLYSGKVLSSGTTTSSCSGDFPNDSAVKGLKDLNHDPLIGSLEKHSDFEELHYNKLPHYLRGGKAFPGMAKSLSSRRSSGNLATSSGSLDNYPVLKRTPEGALVNTRELFYSRLPSYLSAGRYHVVDTVTEPPPPEDDTVTPETMWKQDQEEKRKKREKKKKRKKKRKKQSKKKDKQLEKDRLLYSKLPHYFLAGRRSLVPDRRASEQSYSSSLSDSSGSEDQEAHTSYRSRAYRQSYSPKRDRSASQSSWSSRSPSRSPDRSWRTQRYKVTERSPARHVSYSSSDSDYPTSRTKSTRKRRRSPYSSDSDWEGKRRKRLDDKNRELKNKAIQERRVMYVGGIDDDVTKIDLRRRFEKFGTIEEISLHFRRDRDSYAFVTFRFTCDTFEAIEKGNSDVTQVKYTLCFGGRREFCQVEYADLDEAPESNQQRTDEDDFDTLLKKAMRR